jgi:hypothetical protein
VNDSATSTISLFPGSLHGPACTRSDAYIIGTVGHQSRSSLCKRAVKPIFFNSLEYGEHNDGSQPYPAELNPNARFAWRISVDLGNQFF